MYMYHKKVLLLLWGMYLKQNKSHNQQFPKSKTKILGLPLVGEWIRFTFNL